MTESEIIEYIQKSKFGIVTTRSNLQDVHMYANMFTGDEGLAAITVFHMTINTIGQMFKEAESAKDNVLDDEGLS